MRRPVVFWILAFIITIGSAIYQRMTGPTYPVSGREAVGGHRVSYRFLRSHETTGGAPVEVWTGSAGVRGVMEWKRLKTDDPWTAVPMTYADSALTATLPAQPAAGKLQYRVRLAAGGEEAVLPRGEDVVLRYKGEVPTAVLIVHVLCTRGQSRRAGAVRPTAARRVRQPPSCTCRRTTR